MVEVIDNRSTKSFGEFECILDRILVRYIEPDAAPEGFVVPEKYRQHSNWGEVIAIGDYVVLGNQMLPLTDFVNIGDRVKYSEYSAEKFSLENDGLWIVRIQDCRGVKRLQK